MHTHTLDLHAIFRDGDAIATAIGNALSKAHKDGVEVLEIIPGKGSGTLRRKVITFLHQPHMQVKYSKIEVDEYNKGLIRVYL